MESILYETLCYRGYAINIYYDNSPESSREWEQNPGNPQEAGAKRWGHDQGERGSTDISCVRLAIS